MQTVRSVVRALGALAAVLLAVSGPLPRGGPGRAGFRPGSSTSGQPQRVRPAAHTLAISITGMTPTAAGPDSTVTLRGTLVNHTGSALPGITVVADTSTEWFQYPAQMTDFTNGLSTGTSPLPLQQAGESYQVTRTVPKGATVRWAVSFPASVFYDQFGVFPVQVRALVAGSTYAAARTFLPFWPGGTATPQPKGLQVAWVWPLIDTPQQGACTQTLATSELTSSVAPGGRLSTLLDAGSAWAQDDQLTWDIDPALLSDVSVMTHPYFTGGNAACSERTPEHAEPGGGEMAVTAADVHRRRGGLPDPLRQRGRGGA